MASNAGTSLPTAPFAAANFDPKQARAFDGRWSSNFGSGPTPDVSAPSSQESNHYIGDEKDRTKEFSRTPATPPAAQSTKPVAQNSKDQIDEPRTKIFAQDTPYSCTPTATRQVIYWVTGKDPGDLKQELADASGDPNHYWGGTGLNATATNQKTVMAAHGVQMLMITYRNYIELANQIGTTPVSVSAFPENVLATHRVTIRKDPDSDNYIVTNPTGKVGVGGEVKITRFQLEQGFVPQDPNHRPKDGGPVLKLAWKGAGFTGKPLK